MAGDSYNRAHFPLDMDEALFEDFASRLRAGRRAPKGTLTDARTSEPVKLARHWRRSPLVLEFGSLT